jgi:hypothetical protein
VYQIESDFAAKVETTFNRMIDSVISILSDHIRERAGKYIAMQFGVDAQWAKLNNEIWTVMRTNNDHAFHLADIEAVAMAAACDTQDVLAVLALFSRPSAQLIRMDLQSEAHGGRKITTQEFIGRLTDWWKNKSITDNEWRDWAGGVKVRWIAAETKVHS